MKTCPFCAEEIQDAAIKCKHCGEFLENKTASTSEPQPTSASTPSLPATAIQIESAGRAVNANVAVRPRIVKQDPNGPKGSAGCCGIGCLGFVGMFCGAQVSPEGTFIIGGIFALIGGLLGVNLTPLQPAEAITGFDSECPHCSTGVFMDKAQFEQLQASQKPIFCPTCKNAFGIKSDGKELEAVAVAVKVTS